MMAMQKAGAEETHCALALSPLRFELWRCNEADDHEPIVSILFIRR